MASRYLIDEHGVLKGRDWMLFVQCLYAPDYCVAQRKISTCL